MNVRLRYSHRRYLFPRKPNFQYPSKHSTRNHGSKNKKIKRCDSVSPDSPETGIGEFRRYSLVLIAVRRVVHCDSIQWRWQPLFRFIPGQTETASSFSRNVGTMPGWLCLVLVAVPLRLKIPPGCPLFLATFFFLPLVVRFNSFPLALSSYWFRLARSSLPLSLCLSVGSCHSTAMILRLTGLIQ